MFSSINSCAFPSMAACVFTLRPGLELWRRLLVAEIIGLFWCRGEKDASAFFFVFVVVVFWLLCGFWCLWFWFFFKLLLFFFLLHPAGLKGGFLCVDFCVAPLHFPAPACSLLFFIFKKAQMYAHWNPFVSNLSSAKCIQGLLIFLSCYVVTAFSFFKTSKKTQRNKTKGRKNPQTSA